MKTSPIALWAAVAAIGLAPFAAMAETRAVPVPVITIAGEGRAEATPDMATLTMGVTSRGETAAAALAANSADMERVLAALSAAGIEQRNIQTSSINLNPVWEQRPEGAAVITGYEVSNQVTVRVLELGTLGQVMDGLVSEGVNQLYGLSFGLVEPGPHLDEARRAAVADARRKAALLAEAAGLSLGEVTAIVEGGAGQGYPAPMFAREMDGAGVPVAEGSVSLTATITVSWTLVPAQ